MPRPIVLFHARALLVGLLLATTPVVTLISASAEQESSEPAALIPRTLVVDLAGNAQFQSIQEAIDHAASGDTIQIRPGRYAEDVTIHSKERIQLVGDGMEHVHILGRNRVGAFHVGKWPYGARDIRISGITIHQHGGLALGIFNGEGIVLRHVTVHGLVFGQQVQDVRIEDCVVGESETTGVQFADSEALLVGNFIHDNDHGVTIAGKSKIRLERNVITRSLYEGVVVTDSAHLALIRNTIAKNGGGAAFLGFSKNEVSGNIVGFNKVGFLIAPTSQVNFSYNALYNSEEDYRSAESSPPAPSELKPFSDVRADPGFLDPGRDDFRLRRDTPLQHVGGFPYLGALAPASNP